MLLPMKSLLKHTSTQRALYVQCTYIVRTVGTMYVQCTYIVRTVPAGKKKILTKAQRKQYTAPSITGAPSPLPVMSDSDSEQDSTGDIPASQIQETEDPSHLDSPVNIYLNTEGLI